MLVWAQPEDVRLADLGGSVAEVSDEQVRYWLERAERAILSEVPDLESRIASGVTSEDEARGVQIDLVLGKLDNPRGIRSIQETNGPTSGSVTFGGESPGSLTLTRAHLRALGGASRKRRAARTVPTW